jgi:WD40 repeat protein
VSSVAFSPGGRTLATGDSKGTAYLWNITSPASLIAPSAALHDPSGKAVNAVAFSPDGKMLAVGCGNGSTYLWHVP